MTLTNDWKRIIRKAWSMRLALLAGLLSAAETILPVFEDAIPRGLFAGLSVLAITGAMVARVVVQKDLP